MFRFSCNVSDSFVRFSSNLEFLNKFSQKSPVPNFTEKLPVTAALLHAGQTDKWTDITKLIGVFRAYINEPKMVLKQCGGQGESKNWHQGRIRVGLL